MHLVQIDLLTENQALIEVCQEYWLQNELGSFLMTISGIAKKHGVKPSEVQKIARDSCDAYSSTIVCSRCSKALIFSDRSSYQQFVLQRAESIVCPECQQKEVEERVSREQAQIQRRIAVIRRSFSLHNKETPTVDSLSFEDAVYLLSFIRACGSEDLTVYGPANSTAHVLAPTIDLTGAIILHLHGKGLIRVHPLSSIESFEFEEDEIRKSFTFKVKWALVTGSNIEETRKLISLIEGAFRDRSLRPPSWDEQTLRLWRIVAYHECIEYLEHTLKKHGLQLRVGDKTQLTIENLLNVYSVAEVYNLIWGAVRDAAARYMRGEVTKPHAANTVIGYMQRRAERAQAEGWVIKPARRDFNCPQSAISAVLSNTALYLGDAGFSSVPKAVPVGRPDATPSNPNLALV